MHLRCRLCEPLDLISTAFLTARNPMPIKQKLIAVISLWLAGMGLRLTILAIPPVITLIKDDLHLSATQVGILTGLPVSLFAIAAVLGSLLAARAGASRALLIALLVTAAASVLRSASGEVGLLYSTTIMMSLGVAIMQPALPLLVRTWLPHHIAFGTAVYSNGLLIGEILPVAITPLLLPFVGTSWRISIMVWSLPVLMIAVWIWLTSPKDAPQVLPLQKWWPNWRSPLVWNLGLMFGCITSMYFTVNGFLPVYLHSREDLIASALVALNLGQLPASFLLLFMAGRLVTRAWPYVCGALGALASITLLIFSTGISTTLASAVLGFCCGAILILALALPPLLCQPQDVAPTSAAIFTLSYGCAVVVPVASGIVWDWTGLPASAFLPVGTCALLLLVLARNIHSLPSTAQNTRREPSI
jgi:CP family cyanate transporter-like MFS transporter